MAVTKSQSKKNIAELLAAGVPRSMISGYGDKLNDAEKKIVLEKWKAQNAEIKVPEFLKKDPAFQNLPPDLKKVAVYQHEVQTANNQQKERDWAKALEIATAQADPYFANIIRIAQTEIQNGIAEIQGDYASRNETLKRQIQYIKEDLARNRDVLTLEEQAQLGSLASDLTDRQKIYELNMNQLGAEKAFQLDSLELDYQKNISDINRNVEFSQAEKSTALAKINRNFIAQREQLIGSAANAGLTFSTKRKIAEQRLAEENEGLVESTTRAYNKQQADLLASAEYATTQRGQQAGNIAQKYQFSTEQEKQALATSERQIQEQREKLQRDYSARIAELETEVSRGNVTAQAEMTDLQRKLSESIKNAGLSAEKYLGSSNLPPLGGYTSLGNISGSLSEQKTQDIAQRRSSIFNELTQSSLPV